MVNSIVAVGRLGQDIEERTTSSGKRLKALNIAIRTQQKEPNTLWVRAIIWEDLFPKFEKMFTYLKKGTSLSISGEITRIQTYVKSSGHPNASIEISISNMNFIPSQSKAFDDRKRNIVEEDSDIHQDAVNNLGISIT